MLRRFNPVAGLWMQILSFGAATGAVWRGDAPTASVFLAAGLVIITVRDIERERRDAR